MPVSPLQHRMGGQGKNSIKFQQICFKFQPNQTFSNTSKFKRNSSQTIIKVLLLMSLIATLTTPLSLPSLKQGRWREGWGLHHSTGLAGCQPFSPRESLNIYGTLPGAQGPFTTINIKYEQSDQLKLYLSRIKDMVDCDEVIICN